LPDRYGFGRHDVRGSLDPTDPATVGDLLIWVPAGLTAAETATILTESTRPVTATAVPGGAGSGLPTPGYDSAAPARSA
jgi:hypothetical protein